MTSVLARAADLLDPPENPHRRDPAGWVEQTLGEALWSKQRDILASVLDRKRTAVKSCHEAGKSFTAARLAAWWLSVHPADDAFVVTTAPSAHQVNNILWREIRRAHRKGDLPGYVTQQAEWKISDGVVGIGRKPPDYDEDSFQGIHARYVLVILDEASGIPPALWNGAEAITTGEDCRILAIGNPTDPASEFAAVCKPASGWNVIRISAFDTPQFTGEPLPDDVRSRFLPPSTVDEWRAKWGEGSPLYTSKVLGEFPDASDDAVIPLGWVEQAQQRWRDRTGGLPPLTCVGVDVARTGQDRSAAALRHGSRIDRVDTWGGADTMDTVGRVYALTGDRVVAVVDVIGIGAGVVDRRREQGLPTEPFNASERTDLVDSSGTLGFVNKRSAAWWGLRELLDPTSGVDVELPDDDDLAAELIAPRWQVTSAGKVKVEGKDDIRKRLGRSTDLADAVIQAFWPGEPADVREVVEWHEQVTIGADIP